MEKSAFEALGGSYFEVNGTLIPDLEIQKKRVHRQVWTHEKAVSEGAASDHFL